MNSEEYIRKVKFTEAKDFEGINERLDSVATMRLLHASMGLSTEANECLDILKKHIYYGRPLDRPHLKEEIGDVLYYAALVLDGLGISFEEAMKDNIDKLSKRYPDGFDEDKANNRGE
jgi:NTP pyrophosphatase (non-canonical NTP hydrolase)